MDEPLPARKLPRRSYSCRARVAWVGGVLAFAGVAGWSLALDSTPDPRGAAGQQEARREFAVTARRYSFAPAHIRVEQDDLVKITFTAEDIPHSFTIDAYRIAKRAGAGQSVTFEFHADQPGTFTYYCNLAIDEGCREMRGDFVVAPRKAAQAGDALRR